MRTWTRPLQQGIESGFQFALCMRVPLFHGYGDAGTECLLSLMGESHLLIQLAELIVRGKVIGIAVADGLELAAGIVKLVEFCVFKSESVPGEGVLRVFFKK